MHVTLRRGLPRHPGGEPWPPAGAAAEVGASDPAPTVDLVAVPLRRGLPRTPGGEPFPPAGEALIKAPLSRPVAEPAPVDATPDDDLVAVPLRRGLPRTPGGEPFPPAGEALVAAAPEPSDAPPAPARATPAAAQAVSGEGERGVDTRGARSNRIGRWAWAAVALGFIFGFSVLLARTFVATPTGADFIARYDGSQPLPAAAPTGFPAWLNWAHFFNMFLLALIVKTGLQVRTERRPEAYWAPRRNPRSKISLTLWLHLMLDLAWLALGAVFYVLLFSTGQWTRVVPTSWETIPNAVSAGVQYLTFNWPLENGWVHYNALQELSYFAVIFIASPIAVFSGLRMSPWWPKRWDAVPVKLARALHFPTMIFFVAFIAVHVVLVLTTGFRRNMNAMFAARGDIDPSAYAHDWTGVFIFLGALAAVGLAWWAARPAVVAPLARHAGTVSSR